MSDIGITGFEPSTWERLASGLAALGTFAFFCAAVGYGWYSLLLAMAGEAGR
ncbi:MAG: hypothetical protein ACM35H_10230 [Bacteroidota bacterium]